MTKFPHIPLAEDSTPDNPRSYWDRLMMEQEAREQAKARAAAAATARQRQAAAAQAKLPRPDPNTSFRVTTMAPTRAFMNRDRVVAPETVMGVRRPEFGPPASEVEARLRGQLGIRMENGQPTYRPTAEQKQVMKDHLGMRGKPTKQVDDLKFVQGLDHEAGLITRKTYEWMDPVAVTQGNTVYVRPDRFADVVSFNSDTPFEEAYHSADFAAEGGAGFYSPYFSNLVGGFVATGDEYNGNPYEAFAKGAAKEMHEDYRQKMKRQK